MTKVIANDNETLESLIRRFNRQVSDSKVLNEYRDHQWFTSKAEKRRLSKKQAIKKAQAKLANL